MFIIEMVVDVVVGLFIPARRRKAGTPQESWTVRRSRARMARQHRESNS